MKIVKADADQKSLYALTKPVYPLFGFVTLQGLICAVEYLGEGEGQPNYEAIAPAHYHFNDGSPLHTLIGFTQADLLQRLRSSTLEPCTKECEENQ